jgi:hypothetical protein
VCAGATIPGILYWVAKKVKMVVFNAPMGRPRAPT